MYGVHEWKHNLYYHTFKAENFCGFCQLEHSQKNLSHEILMLGIAGSLTHKKFYLQIMSLSYVRIANTNVHILYNMVQWSTFAVIRLAIWPAYPQQTKGRTTKVTSIA